MQGLVLKIHLRYYKSHVKIISAYSKIARSEQANGTKNGLLMNDFRSRPFLVEMKNNHSDAFILILVMKMT